MFIIGDSMSGIKCCRTDGLGCDKCPYKSAGKPDCMQMLMDDLYNLLMRKLEQIKELEEDLRRARWGTNYNRF